MKLLSLRIYLLKSAFLKKRIHILILAILIAGFCLPEISSFAQNEIENPIKDYYRQLQFATRQKLKPQPEIVRLYVTAYSSTIGQTDDTPCIAASGYDLCRHNKENVIACNFLPFGTKVKFPELDPDKIYSVVDRMHERHNSRMDIWMVSREKAKNFGIKYLTVEIYK